MGNITIKSGDYRIIFNVDRTIIRGNHTRIDNIGLTKDEAISLYNQLKEKLLVIYHDN